MNREIQLVAIQAAMTIADEMRKQKISRQEICRGLDIDPAHACRALQNPRNIEHLNLMAELAASVGMRLTLKLEPVAQGDAA